MKSTARKLHIKIISVLMEVVLLLKINICNNISNAFEIFILFEMLIFTTNNSL